MKRRLKIYFSFCCLLFIVGCLRAQVNLVMNPSFEQLQGCPNFWFQADTAKYWSWINNACDTSIHSECKGEIYSSCCTNSYYCGVPSNSQGFQWPRTGNSYIELLLIASQPPSFAYNWRDYLKGQLNSNLQAGKTYCLTFYYNASNYIAYSVNRLGAYVDNGSISSYNCCRNIPVTPQAENNPSIFMTDTLNWVKIQNSFTAIGNENTITIGNFVDSSTIQYQVFNGGPHDPYYNIDDVSIIPMDLPAYAGRDTSITHGDSTYIGRANEVGLNDDCFWHVLGNTTPIDTVAGMWVKPSTTTSYVLEQNICGTITYDTVMVSVVPTGIKQVSDYNKQVTIYPNPATDKLFIKSEEKIQSIEVYDVLGANVISTKESEIDISKLNAGVYFVEVFTGDYLYTSKFIKE
jgi:hypothetical protein